VGSLDGPPRMPPEEGLRCRPGIGFYSCQGVRDAAPSRYKGERFERDLKRANSPLGSSRRGHQSGVARG